MAWRHDNYRTVCRACTLVGNLRVSTDEEGHVRSAWAGTRECRINHATPRQSLGICDGCGGREFEIGEPVRYG